jgi:hypothetical protein
VSRSVFVLRIRAEEGVDEIRALRVWLKRGLRDFGLVCVDVYRENNQRRRVKMDMRKHSAGPIKPDDVRDGPRTEKIVHISVDQKYGHPVLELESGDTFNLNKTNSRILSKAWGYESDGWLQQEFELSLGSYKDWNTDPPEDKPTVTVKAISPAKPPEAQNGGGAVVPVPKSFPPQRDDMDDAIPFVTSAGIF